MDWAILLVLVPIGYFVLRVAEGIILSIIGNVLTDPVKTWLANRSLVSKRKRIDQLKSEFDEITEMYSDKPKLYIRLARRGLYLFGMAWTCVISLIVMIFEWPSKEQSIISSLTVLFFVVMTIVSVVAVVALLFWTDDLIEKIRNYDDYKIQIEKRIAELDAPLERSALT